LTVFDQRDIDRELTGLLDEFLGAVDRIDQEEAPVRAPPRGVVARSSVTTGIRDIVRKGADTTGCPQRGRLR
jgi:hypothetical protein